MSKPFVRIIANETVIDREMNDDEYAQWQVDNAENIASELANKTAAKLAVNKRQAVLTKLGLSADEAQALLLN